MLVLHRPIEPTVNNGHFGVPERCPLDPQKADIGTQPRDVRLAPKDGVIGRRLVDS